MQVYDYFSWDQRSNVEGQMIWGGKIQGPMEETLQKLWWPTNWPQVE